MNVEFRVWYKKTGTMYYPSFYAFKDGVMLWDWQEGDFLKASDEYMLYTTLKDKNNQKIYQGDIIRFDGRWDEKGNVLEPNNELYEVVWVMGGLRALRINRNHLSSCYNHNDILGVGHTSCEVVGNIFKNPELLKQNE